MDTTKKQILKEIEQYRNTLVLNMFEVCRLEGFDEDEEDYYYVLRNVRGGFTFLSCVGGFIPLYKKIDEKDYDHLEMWFQMNCDTYDPSERRYMTYEELKT